MQTSQSAHKKASDRQRLVSSPKEPKFRIRDRVWLLRRNVKTTRPCDNLDYQRLGRFTTSNQINEVAFRLDLPPEMHLHPVFHVSLLEPYIINSIPDRVVLPPPLVELVDGREFEVKAILDSKIVHKKLYYLVDWSGYTPNDRTWEPVENLDTASDFVATFHRQNPDKPSPNSCVTTRGTRRQRSGIVS